MRGTVGAGTVDHVRVDWTARREKRLQRARFNDALRGIIAPSKAVWIGLGAIVVGSGIALAVMKRKEITVLGTKIVSAGKEAAFAAVLPPGVKNYAMQILAAANKHGVSPWVIAGVMYRESSGGLVLKPPGPRGTGDFLPRKPTSKWFKFANPATGLPPDGLGWGRGLMQIDYGVHNAWISGNDWGDPQRNIDYAAAKLATIQAYFQQGPGAAVTVENWRLTGLQSANGQTIVQGWGAKYGLKSLGPFKDPRPLSGQKLMEATLAAYNAGMSGVLQALAAGLPASAPTAGNDYASWVISRVAGWAAKFS